MLKLTRLNEPIMTNKNKTCLVYIMSIQQVMQKKIQCKFQSHVNIIYLVPTRKLAMLLPPQATSSSMLTRSMTYNNIPWLSPSTTGYVKLHVDAKHDLGMGKINIRKTYLNMYIIRILHYTSHSKCQQHSTAQSQWRSGLTLASVG